MTEFSIKRAGRIEFGARLLTSVSVIALVANFGADNTALADGDGSNQKSVWITLGSQLEQRGGSQEPFAPSFYNTIVDNGFMSPLKAGRPARYSTGFEGSISISPQDSEWVFEAAIRYSRSNSRKFVHQQHPGAYERFKFLGQYSTQTMDNYVQTAASNCDSHTIADFQVGQDVGVGVFGAHSTSVINLGVRYAQLSQRSHANVRARSDGKLIPFTFFKYHLFEKSYHQYHGSNARQANFYGVGPSVSWSGSALLVGETDDSGIAAEWGVNAAALFGRQRASSQHHSSGLFEYFASSYPHSAALPTRTGRSARSHNVVVPNVGGFAAVSFRYSAAQIRFGYRADFFFGAWMVGSTPPKAMIGVSSGPLQPLALASEVEPPGHFPQLS